MKPSKREGGLWADFKSYVWMSSSALIVAMLVYQALRHLA